MMKITYLAHSGFLAELEGTLLLFDYYRGELPDMDPKKKLYVFSSHVHHDHYRREIFDLRRQMPYVRYILSDDIRSQAAEAGIFEGSDAAPSEIIFLKPDEIRTVDEIQVRTLRSTDEGVAFLIRCEGRMLYHAGDLNWWHWEGESAEYNEQMRKDYQREINKLSRTPIDAAFVPADPRLERQYCWGLDYFMRHTETACVFPMHFWDDYGIFDRLEAEACTAGYRDKIMRIEQEGQAFEMKQDFEMKQSL